MKIAKVLACLLAIFLVGLPSAEAHHTPSLTDEGVAWLGACETDNRPYLEGYFDGEAQWLPATWRSAVLEAGLGLEIANTTPNHHPVEVQRMVTIFWWNEGSHGGVATQWPNCWDDAVRAMGFDAPCIGRNVFGCGTKWQHPDPNHLRLTTKTHVAAPKPVFTG